ncbi:hypothetical protein QLQ12_37905 [Actinoplanes sp. NEAU-A12]|uniref:Uncharacterized protein n=1 Tax=Actinoplanes sandaracinus TaxID=3045177 RepID=A0ABT6WXB0_9ACTN|nr:hypothetical protein [Actinoplanes sandaracinus]MDI6104381.1 hypothetical protein [Actinoplanes sandaracinus]
MTNPATVYAVVYGPIIFLVAAAAPFPLGVISITERSRIIWFWSGMAWLGILVVAAVVFTIWRAQPDSWGGTFEWASLFLPAWMLVPGAGVAAVRLLRRRGTAKALLCRTLGTS